MGRVSTNDLGDHGSIQGRVIPKTKILDTSLLNTIFQHFKVRIKGKGDNSREEVAPSQTPRCSSYRKWFFSVTYFTYFYVYIFKIILFVENQCKLLYTTQLSKDTECRLGDLTRAMDVMD